MLVSRKLKVVLLTTHIPIDFVTQLITADRIVEIIDIVNQSMIEMFNITNPRICLCGLNPHAGEGGHLGSADEEEIAPAVEKLVSSGIDVVGPVPADSAFTKVEREKYHVIVAMYHDQGLAPLKAVSFGDAVNITLGLPIVRTSVDHGTAFDKAGTGKADPSSFKEAIKYGVALSRD